MKIAITMQPGKIFNNYFHSSEPLIPIFSDPNAT